MIGNFSWLFVIPPTVVGLKWSVTKGIDYIKKKERKRINALANTRFVYDVATNHLPHIQDSLSLIAKQIGVNLPDPPPIRFMEPIDIDKNEENN